MEDSAEHNTSRVRTMQLIGDWLEMKSMDFMSIDHMPIGIMIPVVLEPNPKHGKWVNWIDVHAKLLPKAVNVCHNWEPGSQAMGCEGD